MLKNMIKKRVELISETILCMFLLEKILEKSVEEIVRRTSRGWLKLCFTGTTDSNTPPHRRCHGRGETTYSEIITK